MDFELYHKIIIDLELTKGYGTNENWVGFFERKVDFRKAVLLEAVNFFLAFFQSQLDDFVVATSYYADSEKWNTKTDYRILKDVLKAEKDLADDNKINILDMEGYFGSDASQHDKKLKDLENGFMLFRSNKRLLRNFSLIGMAESHLGFEKGHCFFISVKNNVILYPHGDNMGYGCFAIDCRKESAAVPFLEKSGELDAFRYKLKPHYANATE